MRPLYPEVASKIIVDQQQAPSSRITEHTHDTMSYSRSVSYNNSTFDKSVKKALRAVDDSADGDFGSALAAVESKRCVPRQFKEIHRAPSEAMRVPDKAILKVDESKLAAKRSDDDLGFAIKQAPGAPLKAMHSAKKAAKQNLAADFFAHASCSATAAVPEEPKAAPKIAEKQEQPTSRWTFARK